jgi:DNA-directed RNA polymerase subunit M/transcription elongation factor TFIIS
MSDTNPLLNKIKLPGRRFRLPSRGLFYTSGELADNVIDGEIELFSMTAVDEISLRSPEYLYSGEAIERVLSRCAPEVKKPLKLLAKDVDFILTALRVVSYGDELELNIRCDKCQEEQEAKNAAGRESFLAEVKEKADEQDIPFELALEDAKVIAELDKYNRKVPRQLHTINLGGILANQTKEVSDEDAETYVFKLSNNQEVFMTPLKMDSSVLSYQLQNDDMTRNLDAAEEYIAFVMSACILKVVTEVEGELVEVTNPDQIAEWSINLPIALKNELADKAGEQDHSWGTTFDYTLNCETCGHQWNGSTLLNPVMFFMMPSEPEELNS